MHFRIRGLAAEHFAPLFAMSDAALAERGAVRRIADAREPGYPCRISLTDSKAGDELILVNYEHHAVASPYRMRFAVYVRRGEETFDAVDTDNCSYIQNYNVGDPSVPGFPDDTNYASSPQGVAIHGNLLYFADTGDDLVSVIDTATLNPKDYNPTETDIHVGINPGDLAVSPDGTQLWVADTGPQTGGGAPTDIKVISTATDTVTATVTVGMGPTGLEVTPDGARVYVANQSPAGTVSLISASATQ